MSAYWLYIYEDLLAVAVFDKNATSIFCIWLLYRATRYVNIFFYVTVFTFMRYGYLKVLLLIIWRVIEKVKIYVMLLCEMERWLWDIWRVTYMYRERELVSWEFDTHTVIVIVVVTIFNKHLKAFGMTINKSQSFVIILFSSIKFTIYIVLSSPLELKYYL